MQLTIFDMMLDKKVQQSYGKTYQEPCPQKTMPSELSRQDYVEVIHPSTQQGKDGAYSGVVHGPQRTAAWRVLDAQYFGFTSEEGGSLCSLHQVLEDGLCQRVITYHPKACRGILDRAEKRANPYHNN